MCKPFILSVVLLLTACGYDNYDDCILVEMNNVTNDIAAKNIRLACRAKFPEKIIDPYD